MCAKAGLWKPLKTTPTDGGLAAGEVAEMDFGKLGASSMSRQQKRQTVWALLIVLPYSRHCFAWPLVQQTLAESIAGLEAAWRFFSGVPQRLILDNFSAAIAGTDPLAPRPTRGFLEVQPGAQLPLRPGAGAQAQGQAPRRTRHPVPQGTLL
ncbi:MAG: DDE-type integrase/transposase/recombinase [Thermoflexaceae bacterium]|nr:DDE-type integrase/transposase/recombinase [Thermoflexaceae bacterium]